MIIRTDTCKKCGRTIVHGALICLLCAGIFIGPSDDLHTHRETFRPIDGIAADASFATSTSNVPVTEQQLTSRGVVFYLRHKN